MKKVCQLAHTLVKHRVAKTEKHAKSILVTFSILSMAFSGVLFYKIQADANKKVSYNLSKEIIDKLPVEIRNKILNNAK